MNTHRGVETTQLSGRSELISWVNTTIGVNIERIEQCSNGAIYIQLIDSVHPGKVQLAKVKFNAELEYELMGNYKVLQSAFIKLGIEKVIDVQKLIKGRYQDNLEFLQWIRGYVNSKRTAETHTYDGNRRRVTAVIRNCITKKANAHLNLGTVTSALPVWAHNGVNVELIKDCINIVKTGNGNGNSSGSSNTLASSLGSSSTDKGIMDSIPLTTEIKPEYDDRKRKLDIKRNINNTCSRSSTIDTQFKDSTENTYKDELDTANKDIEKLKIILEASEREVNSLKMQIDAQNTEMNDIKEQVNNYKVQIDKLENDLKTQKAQIEQLKIQLGQAQAEKQVAKMSKDFYYNKLRKIEIMCQKNENGHCDVNKLFDIMYATDSVL
ncbi:microtubule-associated protein RP/EB family [Babesia bovis T2Bo]|uniref:Microtubule-associated protein RP/EB family member protein n=1 Tax=Babesia bovis TaxID=5865 RepID=A7AM82_BABBO|nr:microtubule-associated protein RP/EB family [Babesia bovis T2Bo]EDO07666.1 microtubule-associated protein RP/EB family [Babesia bovis T2Bo]|eukprot:XP_001611234.1 microtubule-associated protein RP/EB family member protein [Babesia bovis T2Bo]